MVVNAMPTPVTFRYAIVLVDEDGARLGQEAVDVDWEPARECTRFDAVRRGTLDPTELGAPGPVTPRWHRTLGEPYLEGFQIALRADSAAEGAAVTRDFGTGYFGELTRETCARLVEQGRLQKGQQVAGLTAAYAVESAAASERSGFVAEEVAAALPLKDASLPLVPLVPVAADGNAIPGGTTDTAADDMPVFIPHTRIRRRDRLDQGHGQPRDRRLPGRSPVPRRRVRRAVRPGGGAAAGAAHGANRDQTDLYTPDLERHA